MAIIYLGYNMRILGRYDHAKTPALLCNTSGLGLANRLLFFSWGSQRREAARGKLLTEWIYIADWYATYRPLVGSVRQNGWPGKCIRIFRLPGAPSRTS